MLRASDRLDTAGPLATERARIRSRLVDPVRSHRHLLVILILGVTLRLVLLANTGSLPLQIVDEQHYAELASNLLHSYGFAGKSGALTSMRPPLYPVLLAGVWRLTGSESLQAARAVNILLALVTVVAVYALAEKLFDRRTAVLAAAIVCFYPSFLFSGVLLLTEVLFTLLVVLLALEYQALMDRPAPGWAALAGATVGLAALTRSVLWPFPIFLVPLLFLSLHESRRRRAYLAFCLVAGYLAVVGPWAARNTLLQGTLTIVDTMGGMNLRMGNYEHTPEDRMWDAVSLTGDKSWSYALVQSHPEARRWTEGQREKWAQREAVAYMLSHPATTARRSMLKFLDFWGLERELVGGFRQGLYAPPLWFALIAVVATAIAYPLVLLAGLAGFARAVPSVAGTHLLVLAIVVLVTGVHSVVFGHSRYHLPLIPFLSIYAAAGFAAAPARRLLASPRVAAGVTFACVLFIGVWSRELLFRDADRIRALLELLR